MFPYQPMPLMMPTPMGMPSPMPMGMPLMQLPGYLPMGMPAVGPMRTQMAVLLPEPRLMVDPRQPLLPFAAGGFPVPESIDVEQLTPSSAESYLRLVDGGPKPAVTKEVMEETQFTMIKPDLPCRARV